jgi:hypothetical protein
MDMKMVVFILLLAFTESGSGQTSTNLMTQGNWSEPTNGIRGRLLFLGERRRWEDGTRLGAVYVELQNVGFEGAVNVYHDPKNSPLHCELRDSGGKTVAPTWGGSDGAPESSWVALRKGSTVRLDASLGPAFAPIGPNFIFTVGMDQMWVLPPATTNGLLLSGAFTVIPPKDESRQPRWEGTLRLPAVKIPAKPQ